MSPRIPEVGFYDVAVDEGYAQAIMCPRTRCGVRAGDGCLVLLVLINSS